MIRRPTAIAALLSLLPLAPVAGCTDVQTRVLRWQVVSSGSGLEGPVQMRIREDDCEGPIVHHTPLDGGDASPPLAEGCYGFEAVRVDTQCASIVERGCVERCLPLPDGETITIALKTLEPGIACDAECASVCRAPSPDASPPPGGGGEQDGGPVDGAAGGFDDATVEDAAPPPTIDCEMLACDECMAYAEECGWCNEPAGCFSRGPAGEPAACDTGEWATACGGGSADDPCAEYLSCDSCATEPGCGWCRTGTETFCVSGEDDSSAPSECDSWTSDATAACPV